MLDLPEPLVPAHVDLRVFPWVPLEFRRLFASDTWVLGTAEEKVACMHLWCESWHQVPAASLPDDDRLLAHLSSTGRRWGRLKSHAMRGWIRCNDGRFYHPVLGLKAVEAWEKQYSAKERGRLGALKKHDLFDSLASGSATGSATGSASSQAGGIEGKGIEGKGSVVVAFHLPDWVPAGVWAEFVKMRQRSKKPLTEYAKKLIVMDLDKLRVQGQDPVACLEQSIKKNWLGVFPLKGGAAPAAPVANAAVTEFLRRRGNAGQ